MAATSARSSRFVLSAGVLVAIVVAGCSRYQAKPLTPAAVQQSLATPDEHALRVAAETLRHPILQPLTLDPRRGFTPEEAAVVAVIANPELRAERDQRGIAAAQLLQAGLLPNPQIVAGLDFPYHRTPPDNFTAYSIGPEWEVTSLITREQKRRAAVAGAAAVELDVAWKEWQVAQEARTAAYDVLALRGQLAAAREAERELSQNRDVIRRQVDRHEKTLLDLAAAESTALDARSALAQQERDLAHQTVVLNRSLGLPLAEKVVVRTDTAEELPSRLDPPSTERLLEDLEEHRLDLVALKRGYESQDATLRAAILAQFPKVTLGFSAARDTSNVQTIGLGATFDVPLFDRNQGGIASESATRQKLFDEYAARVFAARADIAAGVSDIEGSNAQIAAAEAAIPGLEQLVRTYDAALQQRNTDVLSFYTAQSNLWQKRIDVIKLRQQLVQNWIALELAAGQYLPMRAAPATAPATEPAPAGESPR